MAQVPIDFTDAEHGGENVRRPRFYSVKLFQDAIIDYYRQTRLHAQHTGEAGDETY